MTRHIIWPAAWTLLFTALAGWVFPALVGKFSKSARRWLERTRRRWLPPLALGAFVLYVALAVSGRAFQ